MSYVKHTWQTGEVIDAEKLNHMEDGIAAGGGSGARGADWEAKEGEDGYIENKPFSSEIIEVPDLPKTYVNNFSITTNEDAIDKAFISAEEWEEYIGIPKNKCYLGSGIIFNHNQAKDIYTILLDQPYPGDEAIIEEFGSLEAFGAFVAEEIKNVFPEVTTPVKYIKDFTYTPGQIPELSKLINPSFETKINNNLVSSAPIVIYKTITPLAYIDRVDVWGNTMIFRGKFSEVLNMAYGEDETECLCLNTYITNVTFDKFYFAIAIMALDGICTVYQYDLAFEDDIYFTKTQGESQTDYNYTSIFNYTLNSASQEIVEQLDSKFIEKPEWWFGEKKQLISEPMHMLKNIVCGGGL